MKPHLLFFSDSAFFSGSQNMIVNFLQSNVLSENYNISFAYNYSDEYERGLLKRLKSNSYHKYPLHLAKKLRYPSGKSKNIIQLFFWSIILFTHKYYSILVNTLILFRFLKNKEVDILHINNGGYPAASSCNSMVLAARLHKIKKIIYVVNNTPEDYSFPLRWFDYPFDLIIKYSVTKFVTGSAYSKNVIRKTLNLSNEKVINIFNGINPRTIETDKIQFCAEYMIPNNRFIITLIANLEKRKGHYYLILAISKLIAEGFEDGPIFIFEGDGPEKENIIKWIDEYNLNSFIYLFPRIPNVFDLINASDVIILPSIMSEDLPNIISEAMSIGKPVIGTAIAGIPEQIIHNETGIIVEAKNAEMLKCAIKDLMLDKKKINRFSQAAKKRYNDHFTSEMSINNYINLYKSILD